MKTKNKTARTSQKGIALIITIILSSLMLTAVVFVSREMIEEVQSSTRIDNSMIAYYAAEAGIEDALLEFRYNNDTDITERCVNIETNQEVVSSSECGKNFTDRYYKLSMTNEVDSITTKVLQDDVYQFYVDTTKMANNVTLYWTINGQTPPGNGYRVEITVYDGDGDIVQKLFTCPDEFERPMELRRGNMFLDYDGRSPGKRIIRIKPWYTQWLPGCPETPPDGGTGLNPDGTIPSADAGNEYPHIVLTVTKGSPSDSLGITTTTIESIGYYGGVQRKIVNSVDHISGNIKGIFDFTLYSGGDLIK